jgi:polyisoprenoid-binding protein YceI
MTAWRRSPVLLVVIAVMILGAIGAAAGFGYLFLRGPAPAPVGIDGASPGASAPGISVAPLPSGATSTLGAGGLDGTWTIDPTIGSFSDFSDSFVGYRVNETFTSQKANTAVGRTPQVTGRLNLAGSSITAVDVTADLTRLKSDDDRRDGQLRRQALQTDQFPTATFKLTTPISVGAIPADGQTIDATARGELTLHGVTKTVDVPIQARLSGDVVTVSGSIDIQFADYSIDRPTSFLVLSIEEQGTMELQLRFRHG